MVLLTIFGDSVSIDLLLILIIVFLICVIPLIPIRDVWYDKKSGLKHTFTETRITTEWDFKNPLSELRLLSLFIQAEMNKEQRNKYIRKYNKLKETLENDGYNVSGFRNYKLD